MGTLRAAPIARIIKGSLAEMQKALV